MRDRLLSLLSQGYILVVDGAMGTMLQRRGLGMGECPELWNITHPDWVLNIHKQYFDAGADIVITNTFGGTATKLSLFGEAKRAAEINAAGARLAVQAREQASRSDTAFVFGSVGPTGELLEPLGSFSRSEMFDQFARQVDALANGGVDAIVIETMISPEEAIIAARAAKSVAPSLPVVVNLTYEPTPKGPRTMMGTSPEDFLHLLAQEGVKIEAVGTNCGTGAEDMVEVVSLLRSQTKMPVIAYPNAGLPRMVDGAPVYDETPEEFAKKASRLLDAGATMVGGCCGTTPAHIKQLRQTLMAKQTESKRGGGKVSRRRFLMTLLGAGAMLLASPVASRILFECDVDGDGKVSAADAIKTLRAAAGLTEKRRVFRDDFVEKDYTNKILILYEDSTNMSPPRLDRLASEMIGFGKMAIQGVSMLVQLGSLKVLVDTTTDVSILKNNTRVAGVNPQSIDILLLTHWHFDHMYAYKYILTENPSVEIFAPMSKEWMIKNDPYSAPLITRKMLSNFNTVEDFTQIADRLWIITTESYESDHLPFSPVKESTLVVDTPAGLILVTGDCHPTPMRIIAKARETTGIDKIYLLVGGTSLVWFAEPTVRWFVEQMARLGVEKVGACHTAGQTALGLFDSLWGDNFIHAVTETTIDIPSLAVPAAPT